MDNLRSISLINNYCFSSPVFTATNYFDESDNYVLINEFYAYYVNKRDKSLNDYSFTQRNKSEIILIKDTYVISKGEKGTVLRQYFVEKDGNVFSRTIKSEGDYFDYNFNLNDGTAPDIQVVSLIKHVREWCNLKY